jgi:D-tyrosyl-tRNA(Tyr) deacylase
VRVVIQRVSEAHVSVDNEVLGRIGPGLCLLLGVGKEDQKKDADFLAEKISHLRIFEDEQGKMNRSVIDTGGELLVVSQFTLYGDLKKGNRPSFSDAAAPADAQRLYEYFVERLHSLGLPVATGRFQARMNVSLTNDGPVTIILES